jgi:hypothetical protein
LSKETANKRQSQDVKMRSLNPGFILLSKEETRWIKNGTGRTEEWKGMDETKE